MTKKAYKQKHFSVITKNLRGEVLTKNSVTFRMGWVKNEQFQYLWGFTEKPDFQGGRGFTKNHYIGGNYLKKGAWTVCRFKAGRAWQKRGGVVLLRWG